jgi:hypothetical protein
MIAQLWMKKNIIRFCRRQLVRAKLNQALFKSVHSGGTVVRALRAPFKQSAFGVNQNLNIASCPLSRAVGCCRRRFRFPCSPTSHILTPFARGRRVETGATVHGPAMTMLPADVDSAELASLMVRCILPEPWSFFYPVRRVVSAQWSVWTADATVPRSLK